MVWHCLHAISVWLVITWGILTWRGRRKRKEISHRKPAKQQTKNFWRDILFASLERIIINRKEKKTSIKPLKEMC